MHKGTSFQLDKYKVLSTIPVLHILNATGSLKCFFKHATGNNIIRGGYFKYQYFPALNQVVLVPKSN